MKGLIRYLGCTVIAALLLGGCSNKNSNEACVHEVSMNLDAGNYDAVLGASCADAMQLGAAHFGKAGFDVKDVINRFSELSNSDSSTQTKTDLQSYLTTLIPSVNQSLLDNLVLAKDSYCASYGGTVDAQARCAVADTAVASVNPNYYDANFYISIVDTMTTLALFKSAIETIGGGDIGLDCSSGTCIATCDRNNNGVPDSTDAQSCALLLADGQANCNSITGVTVTQQLNGLTIAKADGSGDYSGIYNGVIISVTGTGANTSSCSGTTYGRLMFTQSGSSYVAATTSDACGESPDTGRTWSCPIEDNGQPVDYTSSINNALQNASETVGTALTSSATGSNDVSQQIQDIQAQACCGCVVTPCNACTTSCSSSSLANYLQNNL